MAFDFMSLFSGGQGAQGGQPKAPTAPAGGPASNANPADNGIKDPKAASGAPGSTQDTQSDPFAIYAEALKPTDEKAPVAPRFDLGDTVKNAAQKLDFTAGLSDEVKQRLASGEALDGQTVVQLLNEVGRQVYMTSLQHQSALTDRFVGMRADFDKQGMPKEFQNFLAKQQIRTIPGADNPAVQDFLESTASRLASRYPDKSAEWVKEQSTALFLKLAEAINPDTAKGGQSGKSADKPDELPDDFWDKYLAK